MSDDFQQQLKAAKALYYFVIEHVPRSARHPQIMLTLAALIIKSESHLAGLPDSRGISAVKSICDHLHQEPDDAPIH